jgi:hypothetical protein
MSQTLISGGRQLLHAEWILSKLSAQARSSALDQFCKLPAWRPKHSPGLPEASYIRRRAGRSLLGSRIGLQGLGCADQYQGPAILVFRRRLHLIAR